MSIYLKYNPGWVQLLIFGSLTICMYAIFSIVAGLIIFPAYHISPADYKAMDLSSASMVSAIKALQVTSSIMLFFIPSVIFAYLSDRKALPYLGFRKPVPKSFLFIAMVIIVAASPMVIWVSEINQHMHLPVFMRGLEKMIRDSEKLSSKITISLLMMKSVPQLITMLLIMAVLPAFAEEVFFRGVLQRLLILLTKRPWAGIVLTGIIFSAIHFQFLGFFPRLIWGVILGTLYWYSGSLWPGILAHFIINGVQIIMVYYNPQFAEKDPNFSVLLITGSTFMAVALTWWMAKASQTRFAEVYDTDDDFHIGPRDQYIA